MQTNSPIRRVNLSSQSDSVLYARKRLALTDPNDRGRLLGKGGRQIREIQSNSGAQIHVRDNEVAISGRPEAVDLAVSLISQIIGGEGVLLLRNIGHLYLSMLTSMEVGREYLEKGIYDYTAKFYPDLPTDYVIKVDKDVVVIDAGTDEGCQIIEKIIRQRLGEWARAAEVKLPVQNGEYLDKLLKHNVINLLKEQHDLQVSVYKSDTGPGISFSGPLLSVEEATKVHGDVCTRQLASGSLPVWSNLLNRMDRRTWMDFCTDITQHIERRFGVRVLLNQNSSRIDIETEDMDGKDTIIHKALRSLQEIMIYYCPDNCGLFFVVPSQAADFVIGQKNIDRFISDRLTLSVNQDKSHIIWVCGHEQSVDYVLNQLTSYLEAWQQEHRVIEFNEYQQQRLGRLIGSGGSNIRKIQDVTNTVITTTPEAVIIHGQNDHDLKVACNLVETAISGPQNPTRNVYMRR